MGQININQPGRLRELLSPLGTFRPMTPDRRSDLVRGLSTSSQVTVALAALTRMSGLLDPIGLPWKSLRVPDDAILDRYQVAVEGGHGEPVSWSGLEAAASKVDTPVGEVVESGLELFEIANERLAGFNQTACLAVLDAALELAEAAANWTRKDTAHDSFVSVDQGDPLPVDRERDHQVNDAELLQESIALDERAAITETLDRARQIRHHYAAVIRVSGPRPLEIAHGRNGNATPRSNSLLAVLARLTGDDWRSVTRCAATVDRNAALEAARVAMRVIGVHASHELLRATTALGLAERSPAWDIASRALLAADAWDRLDKDARKLLIACLLQLTPVAEVVDSW